MSWLHDLAARVSTPAYVFDAEAFARRAEQVRSAFGPKTGLCFSIKANPFLLSCLPDAFDRIEVCSPGELTICEKTNADMRKVIFSGVNKTEADVERAMDDGVGVFTAESWLHVELINRSALRRGLRVPLLVRLTAGSQFGMDEADVISLIRRRGEWEGVEIVGLHYFSGTQKRKPAVIEKELSRAMAFVQRVKDELDFELKRLEYGTGLAVDYFAADADEQEAARLEAVAGKIRQVAEEIELTVEMGRFFAAPCGFYFTRVMDVKCNEGVNYAIVDGGLNQLKYDGQLQGMQIPMIAHLGSGDEAEQSWTLCGSLCTTADVLARGVPLAGLSIGDDLAFTRTGAYSCMEGMSIFLSRDLPAIYLKTKDGGVKLLRAPLDTDLFNTPGIF